MVDFNVAAILVAAVLAFVASVAWYIGFGPARAQMLGMSGKEVAAMKGFNPGKSVIELVRNFILAHVIAYLVIKLGISSWDSALYLALLLWLAFPAVLLSGSVMWDKVPSKLAAIHAGDWLIKLALMSLILSSWR